MKRIIRSFTNLDEETKELVLSQYPAGIEDYHIKSIPTTNGEMLKVIELHSEDAIYLIRYRKEDREEIDDYIEEESDEILDHEDDDTEIGNEEELLED